MDLPAVVLPAFSNLEAWALDRARTVVELRAAIEHETQRGHEAWAMRHWYSVGTYPRRFSHALVRRRVQRARVLRRALERFEARRPHGALARAV